MEPNIGLSAKTRKEVAHQLNLLLADEFLLYIKTLNFHWNLHGVVFHDYHALFLEQYEKLLTISDDVAERVRQLGFPSFGSMAEFHSHTRLKEEPGKVPSSIQMIVKLLNDHETIIRQIRKDIDLTAELGDMGTNNFLCDLIEKHEKIAWMLRATATK